MRLLVIALALASVTVVAAFGGNAPDTSVPYVTGLKEPLARVTAQGQDLRVEVQRQRSQNVPKGFVVAQRPREGSRVDEGSVLKLWVSSGDK